MSEQVRRLVARHDRARRLPVSQVQGVSLSALQPSLARRGGAQSEAGNGRVGQDRPQRISSTSQSGEMQLKRGYDV